MKLTNITKIIMAAVMLLISAATMRAQTGTNWYSMQFGDAWPPLPFNWLADQDAPVYSLGTDTNGVSGCAVDDRDFDYDGLTTLSSGLMTDDEEDSGGSPPFGPNDLWLEFLNLDRTNDLAFVRLHGATNDAGLLLYQLLHSTNVAAPFGQWVPGEIFQGPVGTNIIDFDGVLTGGSPQMFFRAESGYTKVQIIPGSNILQTNPGTCTPLQAGSVEFKLPQGAKASAFQVFYSMAGTANNGTDFVDTNGNPLPGVFVFAPGITDSNLLIFPVAGRTYTNTLVLKIALIPTNSYLIDPDNASATLTISEALFGPVAFLKSPVGLQWHSLSNSLIASSESAGSNFFQIYTNIVVSNSVVVTNVVITNWTRIAGLSDEVYFAIPRQTKAGFTNGDMFFPNIGTDGFWQVGWASASGLTSNMNWCALPNQGSELQGGWCIDETGVYNNGLVIVAGDPPNAADGNVWLVGSNRQARLLTTIPNSTLEGVTTITNDSSLWGPWSACIIGGDEDRDEIFAVDTNGVTTRFSLGIEPEAFTVIPTNQNLYICDASYPWPDSSGNNGAILKLPASFFSNFVGQLLITQGGEGRNIFGELFMVRWDAATTNFATARITYTRPDGSRGQFEHAAFAPLDLPYINTCQ